MCLNNGPTILGFDTRLYHTHSISINAISPATLLGRITRDMPRKSFTEIAGQEKIAKIDFCITLLLN